MSNFPGVYVSLNNVAQASGLNYSSEVSDGLNHAEVRTHFRRSIDCPVFKAYGTFGNQAAMPPYLFLLALVAVVTAVPHRVPRCK